MLLALFELWLFILIYVASSELSTPPLRTFESADIAHPRLRKPDVKLSSRYRQLPYSTKVTGVMQVSLTLQPGGKHYFSCAILTKSGIGYLYSVQF